MMTGADAIIANLTPFRGPGADAGTVYELGYLVTPPRTPIDIWHDLSAFETCVRMAAERLAGAQPHASS